MELFQYAMAITKQVPSIASDDITGRQTPTQNSSFSYPGTLVMDTRIYCTARQRGQPKAQPVRLEDWYKSWKLML